MSALPHDEFLADDPCGCPQPGPTRRSMLRGAALLGATTMFGGTAVTVGARDAVAAKAAPRGGNALVVVSLRGAADGLSLVVPHGDPVYYAARPGIAVPADQLIAKDGFFGMHPAMAPLLPLWTAGKLAAVHATGLPVPNRSHFSAMEELEDADPGSSQRVGWLNRLVGNDGSEGSLRALAVGTSLPTAMAGPQPVMSFASLERARVAGTGRRASAATGRLGALNAQWARAAGPMGGAFREALAAVVDLRSAVEQPSNLAAYPTTDLGQALSSVARTLRADLGVAAVTVDSGIWDMHVGLGKPESGWMRNNATELSTAIAAFFADLGPAADRVTLVTISEFGRRVQENANGGLDHGWGNVMLVAGAGVKGGQYYGRWPGLQAGLDADVSVTTDYRSVLAEIVATRTSASTAAVFPGFQPEAVGVMAA
ncbi:DUF1501 domain-containing protein [Nocardioides sp. MAH-18]|uniref:DUF1501 domain-containing protein n=1 Tax=Nocardioides agri TaxID=2682843 RepID=A0A6L6XTL5_9ACTN|nr:MULTISPECIES: DUF1501 domain-containing protein [unclassified Nocardioides]MBA2954962.1 DUF1501 domain-containing protein [Nocardioides sp. CGMCC 1.13656]MVQ49816.1 DUF1501 domain-containing protein [Nocardioides sp. MAH-18]